MTKGATYRIDGKRTGIRNLQKTVLEAELEEALGGDYITTSEAHKAGIKYSTLRSWRTNGKIRAKKRGAMWLYSRQDMVELIRASK